MKTPVGQGANRTTWLPITFGIIAVATVANDLWLSAAWSPVWKRAIPAASAVFVFAVLTHGNRSALGLCLPVQQVRYWLKISGVLAALMAVIGAGEIAVLAIGFEWLKSIPFELTAPEGVVAQFVPACVSAPILEETIYRLILCVPIAIYSPNLAIFISGAVFAGLHFAYGNPGPDNFVAGYLLAWVYLKSGSIAVPILFHAGGNAIVLFFQVVGWYVLHG